MNLLQSIKIKNFRGFSSLDIEGFNQINLIIGNNNSGKSSILEAIFLIIGMSNPILPDSINSLRGLKIRKIEDFKLLFFNLKLSQSPEFGCKFSDQEERTLKLNPIFAKVTSGTINQTKNNEVSLINASSTNLSLNGLELEFTIKHKHAGLKSYKSTITANQAEIIQSPNNNYKESLFAVYLSSDISNDATLLSTYAEIVKKKKSELVLEAIKKIDNKIESIHALPDGLYFSYRDIDELIPSNILGDGVRKFLRIIIRIVDRRDSIVLIDEIENGLHYTAHKFLWESIIAISNEFHVQLFITSHNIETLKCLKGLLEQPQYIEAQTKLSVFTVSHTAKNGIKTYKYSYSGFKDAIESETEIRK